MERRRKLERIATDLESAAAELGGEAGVWLFTLGDLRGDILGTMPPREALDFVRKLALVIRNAIPHLRGVKTITVASSIIAIVNEVRRKTGKPHYPQLATLIGAAIGLPEFSEVDLKMFIRRRKR